MMTRRCSSVEAALPAEISWVSQARRLPPQPRRRRLFESLGLGLRILAHKYHSYEINSPAGFGCRPRRFAQVQLRVSSRDKVLDGKFENEAIALYILAKGIFCSVALSRILDGIIQKLGG
jgi:hypothetical protein